MNVSEMTILEAAEDATGWRPTMEAKVTTTGANLRSGPSTDLEIVAVLKTRVRVVVLGIEENGMVPVAALGWVSKELLEALPAPSPSTSSGSDE